MKNKTKLALNVSMCLYAAAWGILAYFVYNDIANECYGLDKEPTNSYTRVIEKKQE